MSYSSRKILNSPPNTSHKNHPSTTYESYKLPYTNSYRGSQYSRNTSEELRDHGPYPFAVNIEEVTKRNDAFRTTLWTGEHMQLTLMSLLPGEDIGLEIHDDLDQFIRIEEGSGIVMMGDNPDTPSFQQAVFADYAFIIPAGTWHNLLNTSSIPLKLYSIYAPPQHPFGTVHNTKAEAEAAEHHH